MDSTIDQIGDAFQNSFYCGGVLLGIALGLLWLFSPVYGFGLASRSTRRLVKLYIVLATVMAVLSSAGILTQAGDMTWAGLSPSPSLDTDNSISAGSIVGTTSNGAPPAVAVKQF